MLFRTMEGLKVYKRGVKLYNDIPVPVSVQDLVPSIAASGKKKRAEHPIDLKKYSIL